MSSISDNSSELVSSAIDEFVFYHNSDTRVIVSEIRNLGSSADIDMIADYRVSQVGEMRYGRFRANIGVFDFDECSDLGIITDTCITTDIRIGSDDGSLPEVDIAIDICSRFQNYAFL